MYKKDFDVFVGGKSGVFKGVKIAKKACIAKNIQSLTTIKADQEITAMSWSNEAEKEILLACGSKGEKSVKIFDTEFGAVKNSFVCDTGTGNIRGLSCYDDGILTAVQSGHVKFWKSKKDELLIEAGENLERMRHSTVDRKLIATGGKEHKLQLFDLEKKTKIFTEKNVSHDWLELQVPLWISDIGFLANSSKIVTCGKHGHVRLYDPAAQRKPVISLEMKEQALTTLAIPPRDSHVVVGSGKGVMNLIDLRKPGKILNTYKDFVGSVSAIACPSRDPCIVSVSLDRYLRIHDLNTKQVVKKVYLTSRLSCLLLRSDFSLKNVEATDESQERIGKRSRDEQDDVTTLDSEGEAEYDEIFDKMAVIDNEQNEADLLVNKSDRTKKLDKKKKSNITDGRKKLKKSRDRTAA